MSSLEQECRASVGRLQAALIALYDSVGADPTSPQDVSRAFRLNKTLTWNIAKLLEAPDGLAAVPHVPGIASIEKVLRATSTRGAPDAAQAQVREAARDFERMIEVHVGDRATLDLIIDGLASNGSPGLELSRKRAFLGNSGIYGVQAKTSMMAVFLAPNHADPDLLDMVMLRGYVGMRRLRPNVRLPIFRLRQWSKEGQAVGTKRREQLDPNAPDAFLREFNGSDLPEIAAVESTEGTDYVLQPGPIGNRGAFDLIFCDKLSAGASRFQTAMDKTGEFGLTLSVPTEQVVFDLIAHRDVAYALDAEAMVYAHFFAAEHSPGDWDEASRLPIRQQPVEIAGSPPAVATPLVPRYAEMHQYVYDRLDWNASDFRGVRYSIKYMPLGSSAVMRFGLPERAS